MATKKRKSAPYRRVTEWEQVGLLVDLAILRELKKGNAKVGNIVGLREVALPVTEINRRIGDPEITNSQISGRMSSLHFLDLVKSIVIFPTSVGAGWQITKKGEEVLKKHGHKLDGVTEDPA